MPELLPDWRDSALCAQTDPELFFPDKGGNADPARDICRRCPVREECLDYAMTVELNSVRYGVYGGHTGRERARLAAEARAA